MPQEKPKAKDGRGNKGSVEARAAREFKRVMRPGITKSERGRDLTKKSKPVKRPAKPTRPRKPVVKAPRGR